MIPSIIGLAASWNPSCQGSLTSQRVTVERPHPRDPRTTRAAEEREEKVEEGMDLQFLFAAVCGTHLLRKVPAKKARPGVQRKE